MDNLYLIFAMKRSGHHGFIHWICEQNNNIRFLNNPFKGWENGEFIGSGEGPEKIPKLIYGEGRDLCINIEDFDIDDFDKFDFDNFNLLKESKKIYKIVFVREFKNWIASCMKRREHEHPYNDVYLNLNRDYLNERKEKKESRINLYRKQIELFEKENNYILVSFDKWYSDINYRVSLSERLNLNFDDKGLYDLSEYGKGSSFDLLRIKNSSNIDVLRRFTHFENDREYLKIIENNSEILEKSNKHVKF